MAVSFSTKNIEHSNVELKNIPQTYIPSPEDIVSLNNEKAETKPKPKQDQEKNQNKNETIETINSLKDLFSNLDWNNKELQWQIKKVYTKVYKKKKQLIQKLDKTNENYDIYSARISDIGMKYFFMIELLDTIFSNKNIAIWSNLQLLRNSFTGFKQKLENPEKYNSKSFMDFRENFSKYFIARDKIWLSPELLKKIDLTNSNIPPQNIIKILNEETQNK